MDPPRDGCPLLRHSMGSAFGRSNGVGPGVSSRKEERLPGSSRGFQAFEQSSRYRRGGYHAAADQKWKLLDTLRVPFSQDGRP